MDIRGNGKSDKPWGDYSYNRLADDLSVVIEALRLEDIVLLGFSVGGAFSIRYMSRHGGRHISKLALVDAVSPSFVLQDLNCILSITADMDCQWIKQMSSISCLCIFINT